MRKFDSGATRNNVAGRLNYVKALSPIVLERYVQYLNAHREQADGTMRDFDNWKKGIPTDVYLEGLGRHFIAVWQLAQGFPAEDNKGPVTLEDTLCAIIFGASGWLHEIIKEKRKDVCREKKAKTDNALVICTNFENCRVKLCIHAKPHKITITNIPCRIPCGISGDCDGICEKVKEERKDMCGKKKAKTDNALVICNELRNCKGKRCSHYGPHESGITCNFSIALCGDISRCEKVKEG